MTTASRSPSSKHTPQGSDPGPRCKLAAGLYLVGTPIGNLGDISPRALSVLENADLVLCEDTRVGQKLLSAHGLHARTESYHEHNAKGMQPRILDFLQKKLAIALISDAGMPTISDPGEGLVKLAREAGHAVTVIPGPSAVLTALALSGLPSARFLFIGFLPNRSAARRQAIAEFAAVPATLILFESAPRLPGCLADLAEMLGPRDASVLRELTKLHEEARPGSLPELAAHYGKTGAPKGEIVIVIGPPPSVELAGDEEVCARLKLELTRNTLRDASAVIAAQTGRAKRDVYALAVALSREGSPDDQND